MLFANDFSGLGFSKMNFALFHLFVLCISVFCFCFLSFSGSLHSVQSAGMG